MEELLIVVFKAQVVALYPFLEEFSYYSLRA